MKSPRTNRRRVASALAVASLCLAASGVRSGAAVAAEPPSLVRPAAIEAADARLAMESRAELRFLEHLGWRFVEDASAATFAVREGAPCARESLAAAQQAGDLRILVPPAASPADASGFLATLSDLANSKASRCAYLQRVHVAVQEATRKLGRVTENGRYRFPSLLFWHSPFYVFRPPEPEWAKRGPLCTATESAAGAIRAVYERGGVAECYSAQQVAVFAIQYELYGAAWFDRVFPPQDVAVGKPLDIRSTPIGRYTDPEQAYPWHALLIDRQDQDKDPGLVLARFGPKAFSGLTGIMQSPEGDGGANQNFTIVSVSPRAVEALAGNGGFALVAERAKKAYASLDASGGLFTSAATKKARLAEVDAILSEPVFAEFTVYVHPLGVVSLGRLARKDMEDHGTPVKVELYTDGREDALYQRYRKAWKERWLSESTRPPASPK